MENTMSKVQRTINEHDQRVLETACKVEWDRDPKLRSEFLSVEDYIAFKRAEARGSVWIKPAGTLPG
jgi:hypothetical protein